MRREHERAREFAPQFIGLDEPKAVALAQHLGLLLRVVRDPTQPLTLEYAPHRVTVDLRDGSIIDARADG